jgi:hypothetical protein
MEPRLLVDSFSTVNDENSMSLNVSKSYADSSFKGKAHVIIEEDEDFLHKFSSMNIQSRRQSRAPNTPKEVKNQALGTIDERGNNPVDNNILDDDEFLDIHLEQNELTDTVNWTPGSVEFEYTAPFKTITGAFHPIWTNSEDSHDMFAFFNGKDIVFASALHSEPLECHVPSSFGIPSLASWSKNSELVAFYFPKKGMIKVYSTQMKSFIMSSKTSDFGEIERIFWSPKADYILASTKDRIKVLLIRISMDDDIDCIHVIKRAKLGDTNGKEYLYVISLSYALYFLVNIYGCENSFPCIKFSENSPYLAVAERSEGRDYISIYNSDDWAHVHV